MRLRVVLTAVSMLSPVTSSADFAKANKLHRMLTGGVPLTRTSPIYDPVLSRVERGDLAGAAKVITDPLAGAKEFYNTFVAGIPQHWNRDDSIVGDRNELSALFLGVARDGVPIRSVLTEDRIYFDPTLVGGSSVESDPARHYRTIWDSRNPREALRASPRPGFQGVGIFTSLPWAQSYIEAGTNRRPIYGMLHHLYCTTIQQMQTTVIPDAFVRKDVPRAPGGEVSQYFTNCTSCHAFMDALIPRAFSRFDFLDGKLTYGLPRDKLNESNFTEKAITDDMWHFFYTDQMNETFGFQSSSAFPVQRYSSTGLSYAKGQGLRALGEWIGNSDGFYRCLVKQLVSQAYLKKQFSLKAMTEAELNELAAEKEFISEEAKRLKDSQNLRETIESVVIHYLDY